MTLNFKKKIYSFFAIFDKIRDLNDLTAGILTYFNKGYVV